MQTALRAEIAQLALGHGWRERCVVDNNAGQGVAHLNMNNSDNRVNNLKWVDETEARKMLLEFEPPEN